MVLIRITVFVFGTTKSGALKADLGALWAVYTHIIELADHPTYVYVGSGTALNGILARLKDHHYLREYSLPRRVNRLFKKGYTITQSRLLATMPIPQPQHVPEGCAVIILLEGLMTYLFGTCLGFVLSVLKNFDVVVEIEVFGCQVRLEFCRVGLMVCVALSCSLL